MKKMVRYVMNQIIDMGSNIKLIMTLNLFMIPLNKILETNYTYGSPKQQIAKNILCRITILFISQIMGEGGWYSEQKEYGQKAKISC